MPKRRESALDTSDKWALVDPETSERDGQGSITGLIGAVLIGISLVWSLRYNRKHGRQTDTV